MIRACALIAILAGLLAGASGCATNFGPRAVSGITFYVPGAGNTDFSDSSLRRGLRDAGYEGEVSTYWWTISFNIAIDQTVRINARLRARLLARRIEEYCRRYPDRPVNLIGLSAGSGIAVWALEHLRGGCSVENVVLLSSSLSSRYDVSRAAARVRGRIYNYYSPYDAMLALPMKLTGTIDGEFGEDAAGSVGLQTPGARERVVNVAWRPEFSELGYNGGHTDSAAPNFVRTVVSRHVIGLPRAPSPDDTKLATLRAPEPPDEPPN